MNATIKYDVPTGCTLSEEHGWLCVRDRSGWLLWSMKIEHMPAKGVNLSGILRSLSRTLPENPRKAALQDDTTTANPVSDSPMEHTPARAA